MYDSKWSAVMFLSSVALILMYSPILSDIILNLFYMDANIWYITDSIIMKKPQNNYAFGSSHPWMNMEAS